MLSDYQGRASLLAGEAMLCSLMELSIVWKWHWITLLCSRLSILRMYLDVKVFTMVLWLKEALKRPFNSLLGIGILQVESLLPSPLSTCSLTSHNIDLDAFEALSSSPIEPGSIEIEIYIRKVTDSTIFGSTDETEQAGRLLSQTPNSNSKNINTHRVQSVQRLFFPPKIIRPMISSYPWCRFGSETQSSIGIPIKRRTVPFDPANPGPVARFHFKYGPRGKCSLHHNVFLSLFPSRSLTGLWNYSELFPFTQHYGKNW